MNCLPCRKLKAEKDLLQLEREKQLGSTKKLNATVRVE
jgi:hypothetical protein